MTRHRYVLVVVWLAVHVACGGGGNPCIEGQACTPGTTCHVGTTSCASGSAVCVDTGTQVADGTACGTAGSCQSGVCKRTVSGTFQTTFWTDDGNKVTGNALPTPTFGRFGPPAVPSALLVPDSSASGYAKFPVSVDANQSFSVSGVPAGPYFLELDKDDSLAVRCAGPGGFAGAVSVVMPQIFELSANVPDLKLVSSARKDLVVPTAPTNMSFDITDMDSWVTGSQIQVTSSQALTNYHAFFSPAPAAGVTSFTGTSPWFADGLADGGKATSSSFISA